MLASPSDLEKKESIILGHKKKLGDDGKCNENILRSDIRSAIKKIWMKHPTKLAYFLSRVYADMDPTTRTKWLVDCEICKKPHKKDDVQIDHKIGEHPFTSLDQIRSYAESILSVSFSEIQVLCKPCHLIKTYAERYNLSWEDAEKEKKIISQTNLPVVKQKLILKGYGYKNNDISNDEKRRNCFRKILEERP